MSASAPVIGDTYAVGIGRRWGRVVRAPVEYRLTPYTDPQPNNGVLVEYDDGDQEIVHINDVQVTWGQHLAAEERKNARKATEDRIYADIADAIGVPVGETQAGTISVRVPLEALHAYILRNRDGNCRARGGTPLTHPGIAAEGKFWCCVCGENVVDAREGIDTCPTCLEAA